MHKNRPRIKFEKSELDHLYNLILLILVVLHIVYVGMSFSELPEIIPTHFNAEGQADGYGSKGFIWLLPGVSVLLYAALSVLIRYPHIYNYLVQITEENAAKQYRIAIDMIRILNVVVQILFFYISYLSISGSQGKSVENSSYIIPLIILGMFILIAYFLIKSVKNK